MDDLDEEGLRPHRVALAGVSILSSWECVFVVTRVELARCGAEGAFAGGGVVTEDDVRRIVHEELDLIQRERAARDIARRDQHEASRAEMLADHPSDGRIVAQVKATLRGETGSLEAV
jgi:hypothetical protein